MKTKRGEEKQPEFSEDITAKLKPDDYITSAPRYKMMGCDRSIEDISVSLHKSEKYHGADCWVMPSYKGGIEFHERTEPDRIRFSIYLEAQMFDEIAMLLKRDTIGDVIFCFGGVDGFYSDWSPETQTDEIKALGSLSDHNFELPDNVEYSVPRAGKVSKFIIRAGTTNYSIYSENEALEDLGEDELEEGNFLTKYVEPERLVSQNDDSKRLEVLLRSLRLPLWLSVIALIAIAYQLS